MPTRCVALPLAPDMADLSSKFEHCVLFYFYRAMHVHSADYAMVRCLSVHLSVHPSVTRRY